MSTPEISVVMSVYNGSEHLRDSIESILSQQGVDLEFIVVNDGSTDGSLRIVEEYAACDRRIRLINQENQGLTKALIRGCAEVRGKFIARQDCGDISLPGRLQKQLELAQRNTDAVLVSCGTRFIGPHGEHLFDSIQNSRGATNDLLAMNLDGLRGPSHHGSTFFQAELYREIGGYRPQFYFAQDLDLWKRMIERGKHIVIPEILYETFFSESSISGLYRKQQVENTKIILECTRRRRSGMSEEPVLEKASTIRPTLGRDPGRISEARSLYFIGSCLRKNGNPKAAYYFKRAFAAFPLHLKSAVRLLLG